MTDIASDSDGVFSYLSRSLSALVVAPLDPSHGEVTRLRGLARVSDQRVRVALSRDERMASGVALEFDLNPGSVELTTSTILEFLRAASGTLNQMPTQGNKEDGHGNAVVRAEDLGFVPASQSSAADLNLYSLLGLFEHGGGFPWFENVLTFSGFMLSSTERVRLYLRRLSDRKTFGIDLPIRDRQGRPTAPYGTLSHELVPLIRDEDTLVKQPRGSRDDYCAVAFDLAKWLGREN